MKKLLILIKGVIRLPLFILQWIVFVPIAGIFVTLSILEGLGSKKEFYQTSFFRLSTKIQERIFFK